MMRVLVLSLLLAAAACGRAPAVMPPQKWQGLEVSVESRPTPVRPGMNEFLVIVSKHGIRPGEKLLVSLRIAQGDPWRQAIQDGDTGVFRKALRVRPGDRALHVQILREEKGESGELVFPLQGMDGR